MALTGYWSNGICTASQAEAVAALNSQFPVVTDAFIHVGNAVASGVDGAQLTTWTFNLGASGGAWFAHSLIFYFVPCDPDLQSSKSVAMFSDGLQMGWGVVAAMAAALSIIFIKKSFFR